MSAKPKEVAKAPPHIIVGDHVYFQHKEHGVLSGEVRSAGADGCKVAHEKGDDAGHFNVLWPDVLGHKERKQRKLILLESGEDGHIALDEDGKRVFVRGDIPAPEAKEPEEQMKKSLGEEVPAGMSMAERIAIDTALLKAGYEPSLEYIHKTYGEHWSRPVPAEPMTKSFDDSSLVKAIAETQGALDAAISNVRSEVAMQISALAVAMDKQQPPSISITVPEQPAPVVHVAPPSVEIGATTIHADLGERP